MDHIGFCVRVDALDGYLDKIMMLSACKDYKSIAAIKHNGSKGENQHYHLVIQTQVQSQAFRVRMRKIFDAGKGNGHMSIKPWDGNNDALAYLFHEDAQSALLVQYNISDETIANCRDRNREVVALVNASKSKASWLLEEVVFDQIKDIPYLPEHDIGQRLILAALRNGKYVPQPWHVKAMTQRIMFRKLEGFEEKEEEFAMRLSRQIFYRE